MFVVLKRYPTFSSIRPGQGPQSGGTRAPEEASGGSAGILNTDVLPPLAPEGEIRLLQRILWNYTLSHLTRRIGCMRRQAWAEVAWWRYTAYDNAMERDSCASGGIVLFARGQAGSRVPQEGPLARRPIPPSLPPDRLLPRQGVDRDVRTRDTSRPQEIHGLRGLTNSWLQGHTQLNHHPGIARPSVSEVTYPARRLEHVL